MAYNERHLFHAISTRLTSGPRITLSRIARELGVDRHTAAKVIRSLTGLSFRAFSDHLLTQQARALAETLPALAKKEVADRLGYSSARSFARLVRRTYPKGVRFGKLASDRNL